MAVPRGAQFDATRVLLLHNADITTIRPDLAPNGNICTF